MLKNGPRLVFDPVVAAFARDEGMKRTLDSESAVWKRSATSLARDLPADWIGMGEDLRLLIETEIGEPHTPEVFGALFSQWANRGWFEPLDLDSPKSVPSHASKKRRWRRTEKR